MLPLRGYSLILMSSNHTTLVVVRPESADGKQDCREVIVGRTIFRWTDTKIQQEIQMAADAILDLDEPGEGWLALLFDCARLLRNYTPTLEAALAAKREAMTRCPPHDFGEDKTSLKAMLLHPCSKCGLMGIDALLGAAKVPLPPPKYGYCPLCNARGVARERRISGNDRCQQGHTYPSRLARPALAAPKGTDPPPPDPKHIPSPFSELGRRYRELILAATEEELIEAFGEEQCRDDAEKASRLIKRALEEHQRGK